MPFDELRNDRRYRELEVPFLAKDVGVRLAYTDLELVI
jgi:hypothetical protein